MTTITERELLPGVVASAVAGDEAAFARIVAAHHEDMVRVAYLVAGDADIAAEAAQAAWPIAWRKLASLRDEDRIRPWLVTIAVNEARQLLRRRHRRWVVEIAVGSLGMDSEPRDQGADARDRSLDVLAALHRLPPDDRGIVAMRYAFGLTSAEIGRAMGLSAAGVRYRLAHALGRLRKDLGE